MIHNITYAEYSYNLDGEKISIKITVDGINWTVPINPANRHYQAIQEWIANGGTVIDNGGNN